MREEISEGIKILKADGTTETKANKKMKEVWQWPVSMRK